MGSFCSSSTSSTTQIPSWLSNEFQGTILPQANAVAQTPYAPYTGQLTAGLNPLQMQGLTGLNGVAGASIPYVQAGSGESTAGYNTAAGATPYYAQGAAGLGAAQPYFAQGASTLAGAQPYYQQADSLATASAGNIDPTPYLSPYQQQVIDATMAQSARQNAITDNQALGSAITAGNSFGGDRAGVAQAQLASSQQLNDNSLLAGLNNQNWTQALQTAEAQHGFEGQAANTVAGLGNSQITAANAYDTLGNSQITAGLGYGQLGNDVVNQGQTMTGQGVNQANIGSQYQNNALNAYNAEVAGGTQQQATEQAGLNAAYQQYQNQIAFPYQQLGWLAGVASGINPGSSTTGTSTPSALSTIGLAAGGRVARRAAGGGVGNAEFPTAGGPLVLNGSPGSAGLVPAPPMVQAHAPLTAPTNNNNNNNKSAPAQPTLIGGLQQIGNLIKPGSFSSPTGASNSIIGGVSQGVNLGKQAVNFFNGLGAAAPGGVAGAVGSTSLGGAPLVAPTAANSMIGGLGDAASSVAGGIGDAASSVAGGLGDAGAAVLAFLSSGGAVKRYANGGGVNYLFPMAGGPTTVSSTPGGGGLIPAVRFSRNTFQTAPKGFGAPNPNPSHTAIDSADQINALVDGVSKWFTPSAAPQVSTNSSIADPTVIGGTPYARGGVVPQNYPAFAGGGPVEREAVPHNPGSGIKPSIGTIGIYGRGGLSPRAPGLGAGLHSQRSFARGGFVPRGYADGGSTDDDVPDFDQRIAPALDAIADGTFDPVGANSTTLERKELKDSVPLPVARPTGLGVDPRVINPDDPIRLEGTYAAGEPAMTPGLAAANFASNQDDAQGPADAYAPAPGLGGVAAINRQAGIAPESDNADLAGYDSTQGNKGGLRGPQAGAPLQITPPAGLGQGRIAPPQSPPNTGSAPAPGLLGSIGMTKDGAGALLQGVAGFMTAAGKGTLLGGLGSAITGATGAMAAADKHRQEQAQQDFENQIKAATAAENQQRVGMEGAAQDRLNANSNLVKDKNGNWVPNQNLLTFNKTNADNLTKDNWLPIGNVVSGDTVHPLVQNRATGEVKDAVTGQAPKDTDKIQPKGQKVQLSADDAKDIARYYVTTGDRSRMMGLGLNGDNKALVNHAISQVQKDLNVSDQEMGSRVAEWEGRKAGQRTLGVQEAKMGSAAFEAEGAIKQARGIIEKLPRTSFLPLNKLIQGYQNNTLNPDQTELYGRAQAIVNTYSAVMSRGANITSDSARDHANALLNTAGDPATFNRMLDTMLSEISMAKNSPERMRQFYREQFGAKAVAPESPTGAPPGAAAAPKGTGELETKTIGGQTYFKKDGQWYQR